MNFSQKQGFFVLEETWHGHSSYQVGAEKGSCSIVVQRLPGMRDVPGSNPLGGNLLCSPRLLEETINWDPDTPIPTTHALICEELKDSGITLKAVP